MSASVRSRIGIIAAVFALAFAAFALCAQEAQASNEVVARAETYLGVPYVYGGESRSGVDCSGLVTAVYSDLGVSLPRTSQAQYHVGTPVSSPAPGDLVFSDYGHGVASHVGIATGGGQMINAPYPGTAVRYDPIIPEYVNGYRSVL